MKFPNFLRKALFYISVPKCVGCGTRLRAPGAPLCPECFDTYIETKSRNCSVCSRILSRCKCTNRYLDKHHTRALVKVYRYVHDETLPSNKLIYSLKQDNRRDVIDFLSSELADAFNASFKPEREYIVTYVPRRRSAIRKYGIDHSRQLAAALADKLGASFLPLLRSKAKAPQKMMSGEERAKNASYALRKGTPDIKGKTVILVDDIVTTGSSMGACADIIHGLGAKSIIGATVSIAFKDKSIKFETNDRFHSYK